MEKDLIIPIHRATDKEYVLRRLQQSKPKGLSIEKANELGITMRIAGLMCAMHTMSVTMHYLFGEIEAWLETCAMNRQQIKKACLDFERAYDKWYRFWGEYQTVNGIREMNSMAADLLEQYMKWVDMPMHWDVGQPQNASRDTEPLIEIDRGERVWRIYRYACDTDVTTDDENEEWCVMRSNRPEGRSTMTVVERGMDRASAQMSAKRLSANEPGTLYSLCKLEKITEKRLDAVPYKAYYDGELIGDVKSVIKDKGKDKEK